MKSVSDYEPSPADRELIVGTMRRWRDGEPVWSHDEIITRWGYEFRMYRTAWAANEPSYYPTSAERSAVLFTLRDEVIGEFGFPIPCRELLDALECYQPIVEIGAGTGYLTALMRHRGIGVIGTDSGHGFHKFKLGTYDPMQMRLSGKTAVRRYRDRTVFCSWPSLAHTWFRQALRAMRIGQRIISVEEDACGDETTWDYRDAAFEREADIPLPAWTFLNDRAGVWIKKRS
jgi:hypothetical protein